MRVGKIIALSLIALLMSPLLLIDVRAQAQTTPVPVPAYITFNDDNPGSPPETGGLNKPSSLITPPNSIIEVRNSAAGLDFQPVALELSTKDAIGVIADFPIVTSGIVSIEATASTNRLLDGFFLRSITRSGSFPLAVVTDLWLREDGTIGLGLSATYFANYGPDEPFRVRVEIDLDNNEWAVTIDSDLNGFSDDTTFDGLSFANDPSVIPGVGSVWAVLNENGTGSTDSTTIAYDDISISANGITVVPVDITDKMINICAQSPIKAAVLGRPFFNAADIDPETVFLASASTRTVGKKEKPQAKVKDTDRDGNPDLEARFASQELGLTGQDEFAILNAVTFDGKDVEGLDAVSVRAMMCSRSTTSGLLDQN